MQLEDLLPSLALFFATTKFCRKDYISKQQNGWLIQLYMLGVGGK